MKWQISKEEAGISLLLFLKGKLSSISVKQIKRLIDAGRCKVNGRIEKFASIKLGSGDRLEIETEQPLLKKSFSFSSQSLLYEDAYLLALNKPPGITSNGQGVGALLKEEFPILYFVHRLDRETSGVLLLAKTKWAQEQVEDLFRQRLIHKTYFALVDGIPATREGIIQNYLGKLYAYEGQTVWGVVNKNEGVASETSWICEKKGDNASLMRFMPKTGRTHQIRVHASSMGHPILGDTQYGKTFCCPYKPSRILLHAFSVELKLPWSHKQVMIKAPFPDDFQEAMNKLATK